MRRSFERGVLFAAILLFFVSPGSAQQPPDSRFWQQGVSLLGQVQVRDELKLTADQQAKITAIGDVFVEKHLRPAQEPSRKLTAEETQKLQAELYVRQKEAIDNAKMVLTDVQAVRFRQIEIWVSGPKAFAEADVARELKLTDEQKGALRSICDEFDNEVNSLVKLSLAEFRLRRTKEEQAKQLAENYAKRDEVRAAKVIECLAVLTDEQRAAFEKMRGAKFERGRQ